MATAERSMRKDKNQNIQVFVRLRPINQRERAIRSIGVVDVVNNKEVVVRQSPQTSLTKKFTFDRAFGPNAEQVEVYKDVVSPLIAEVLAGYNCTVFAYGQTGTGKTHTMVGESTGEGTTWQNDPLAGIIPRALSQLFDELRISNSEYTVRVSYLELYNEELFDLLSTSDDNSKLRIYEDVTRKGSTIVNGLEEVTVYNKNEVYEIMAQGQERKRVASTLMNAQSSNQSNGNTAARSHTVFTIVVHMKENCPKGEELVKIGKLNLVDLAGSENISKAGSDNPAKKERARECVNINQSLLTLGRVITALVEKHPHIPYRESKLTRILQESLGGRTKTSIIATISPGHKDLEETMSTLEYAHRAKNIQNKPEVNQKLTKQAILKEFAEEVDKLKRELTATREKNGVYLPTETYVDMQLKDEEQRREIQELLLKKRAMEDERAKMEAVFNELEERYQTTESSLRETEESLEKTKAELTSKSQQCLETGHLLEKRVSTERELSAQARALLSTADLAKGDLDNLHESMDRRRNLESVNRDVITKFRQESTSNRENMLSGVQQNSDTFTSIKEHMQATIDDYSRDTSMVQETNIQDMKLLVGKLGIFMNQIKSLTEQSETDLSTAANECKSRGLDANTNRRKVLEEVLSGLLTAVKDGVDRAAGTDVTATVNKCTQHWLNDATARVQCLQNAHAKHNSTVKSLELKREDSAKSQHRERLAKLRAREDAIKACIEELEKDKQTIEARISRQLALIEAERTETEERLNSWMEEERRQLEERLANHVANERNALNVRLERYMQELNAHRDLLAETTQKCVNMQQMQLEVNREEMEIENGYLDERVREKEESLEKVEEFDKEFGEGTSAITAEMEAFGNSVTHVVDHTTAQFIRELRAADTNIQRGVSTVLDTDAAASQQCIAATEEALDKAVRNAGGSLTNVLSTATETSKTSISSLETMTTRTSEFSEQSMEHQRKMSSYIQAAGGEAGSLLCNVRQAAREAEEVEMRYLEAEYKVYQASGNTPQRREFRYPRDLAATSPHERILARFRMRQERDRAIRNSPDSCPPKRSRVPRPARRLSDQENVPQN